MKEKLLLPILLFTSVTAMSNEKNVFLAERLDAKTVLSNYEVNDYCITNAYATMTDRVLNSKGGWSASSQYTCRVNFDARSSHGEKLSGYREANYQLTPMVKSDNLLGNKMESHFGYLRLELGEYGPVVYSPILDLAAASIYNVANFVSDIFTKDLYEQKVDANNVETMELRYSQMAACQVVMLELVGSSCDENQTAILNSVDTALKLMTERSDLYNAMIPRKSK